MKKQEKKTKKKKSDFKDCISKANDMTEKKGKKKKHIFKPSLSPKLGQHM